MNKSSVLLIAAALSAGSLAPRLAVAASTPPVGTVRQWLGLDEFNGSLYRKDYTLRGVGSKVELWVANDLAFPPGDCRAAVANSTTITDPQVTAFIGEFDGTIFPRESTAFSTPPNRDGTNAQLGPDVSAHGGVYTGDGDKTVLLVDNIRDANFHDFPATAAYLDALLSPLLLELFDRNVLLVDAFDWAHRTGATPPDATTADPCTSRPAAPRFYESAVAREWQKLAHSYADPSEHAWVVEGMSGFAQSLTDYVDFGLSVTDRGANRDLYCFQGFGIVATPFNPTPTPCGGPENSLTRFDESSREADRGIATAFTIFLADRYGTDFVSALHRDAGRQGITGLAAALLAKGIADPYVVIHDFQSMVLLDRIVGDTPHALFRENQRFSLKARQTGTAKARVTTPSLHSSLNLDNPDAYDDPGVAPNGADYILLRNGAGQALTGNALQSVSFIGSPTLTPEPLAWSLVTSDPDRFGNSVLFSGNGNSLDAAAVTSVTVPTVDPTLRFVAKYGAEFAYDYGYVQVSTNGGQTYTSIAGDKTVPGLLGPGLNGTTSGFEPHTFDLSAYAGQNILLAFRYVSDSGVNEGGLLIDDVSIGGTTISDGSSLAPFDSPTERRPIAVANWNVRLVAFDDGARPRARQIEFNATNQVQLRKSDVKRLSRYQKVVAIVAYDEPTETHPQYAPYQLTVNGVVQPGGAPLP